MLTTPTTYLSLLSQINIHPNIYPLPCKPNPRRSSLRVHFPTSLITGPSRRHHSTAALHVCNKLIDVFPLRAIINSGASDHFVSASYTGDNPQSSTQGLPVQCANIMIMKSTGTDFLSLPRLPAKARGCHTYNRIHAISDLARIFY
jgi:hypothetical protein